MSVIEPEEAKEQYGIRTSHEKMPNGELRFRLLSETDSTRYIRTQRPSEADGEWQEAHYHRSVKETYIVQKGWIAFAEELGGRLDLFILKEGDIRTTKPTVKHNVYMSSGAEIHTIKHGLGQGKDWEPSPELTNKCLELNTEKAINDYAAETEQRPTYDEEYRHFDTLIWQMPAWSTAIFLGNAAVLGSISENDLKKLFPEFTFQSLTAGFLIVVFIFLFGLTLALYRFRCHQAPMKNYKRTKWWASASTHLQIYVTAQAFVVLYLALGALSFSPKISAIACAVLFIIIAFYRECKIRED